MMKALASIEPRYEKKGKIIYDELDELNEVIFIYKGTVFIGFEINKKKKYCLRYKNGCVIGAFGCTFNQRSNHVAYANTNCDGYFIRKTKW